MSEIIDGIAKFFKSLFSPEAPAPVTQPPIEQAKPNPTSPIQEPMQPIKPIEAPVYIDPVQPSQPQPVEPTPTPNEFSNQPAGMYGEQAGMGTDGLVTYNHYREGDFAVSTLRIDPSKPEQVAMKDRFMQGARPTPMQPMEWDSQPSPRYRGTFGEGL